MSSWPSILRIPEASRRIPCRLVACAGLLWAMSLQAWSPDEVADLRVTTAGGRVALAWQGPSIPADSYIVRRCTLPSLRGGPFGAPYFGDCVGSGTATTWDEPSPAGTVFYLVSGSYAGVEGSLGDSWNGRSFIARPGEDCGNPSQPGPLTLVVILDNVHLLCGSGLVVFFPPEALTFVSADCTGVQSGFVGAANEVSPGRVDLTCGSATGAFGSGEIARFEFQRAACPAGRSAFDVTRCRILAGDPDCGTPIFPDETCRLIVP
jgi:hypothetical protein